MGLPDRFDEDAENTEAREPIDAEDSTGGIPEEVNIDVTLDVSEELRELLETMLGGADEESE